MRPLLACTRFRRPRLTHACDRPARRWIAREATAVGESAPTSTPRLVSANRVTSRSSQVVWLKARRSSGHNPASTEARAVRSPEVHGPFTGGLSSCHRRTEFARRNARRRAAGAGSVPRARAMADTPLPTHPPSPGGVPRAESSCRDLRQCMMCPVTGRRGAGPDDCGCEHTAKKYNSGSSSPTRRRCVILACLRHGLGPGTSPPTPRHAHSTTLTQPCSSART